MTIDHHLLCGKTHSDKPNIEAQVHDIVNNLRWASHGRTYEEIKRTETEAIAALMRLVEQERTQCWHCGLVLLGVARPRCEQCPAECDVEGCDEPGCKEASK